MKVIKRYLLLEFDSDKINGDRVAKLTVSNERDYGSHHLFDTEQEAIEEAYGRSKYRDYIIVPHISFSHFED